MKERRLSLATITLSTVGFLFFVAAGTQGLVRKWTASAYRDCIELAARVVFMGVALWLGWWLFRRLRKVLDARPVGEAVEPVQPSIDRLMRLQRSVADGLDGQFSNQTVTTFVKMITSPALYRTRVTENIDFEERIVTQRVIIEFALPMNGDSADTPRYVLLFAPKKGQVVDNLKIMDGSGKPLADLSFEESTELVAAGLRLLLHLAIQSGRRKGPFGRSGSGLNESQRALELILLELLTRRGTVDPGEVQDRMNSAFLRYGVRADTATDLSGYVTALSVAYPIVAVVPKDALVGGRSLLRYEQTLIPTALTERGWNSGWLRVLLGLRPSEVVVPVRLASTAGSFHLYVNGPSNKYVLDQRFRCRNCHGDVSRSWEPVSAKAGECSHREIPDGRRFTDVDRHYRVTPKLGQSFVHLYTRDFGGSAIRFTDLELLARFKETPPGSRATAVVTALVATFLLAIMGHLASGSGTPAASLPGFVLALPAVAATWFGFTADGRSLVGSSLLARLSQIVTAVVSAAAIAVYFTSHNGRISGGLGIVGITEPVWVGLFLISAFNLLYVSYRFAVKIQVYNGLLRKKERQGHSDADNMKV